MLLQSTSEYLFKTVVAAAAVVVLVVAGWQEEGEKQE